MAIRERHQASEPVGYGRGFASLANIYRLQGRFSEALAHYNQAVTLFERAGPAGIPALSQTYNHLGVLSFQQREFQDAQRHYARALALMQSLLGPEHPEIAVIKSNIGQVLRELKEFAEAERHYREALELRVKMFGREHEQVALVLHKLGRLRQDQGAWPEALSFFKDAAEIRIRLQTRTSDRAAGVSLVSGQELLRDTMLGVVQSAWRTSDNQKERRIALMSDAFIFAQSAGRAAVAGTVAQMAARLARGDTALAELVGSGKILCRHTTLSKNA